jgi:hypothetical protein
MSVIPDNNYVHNQGDIVVYPGGGGAPAILPVGSPGQVITANPNASNDLGVQWENTPLATVKGSFTLSAGTHTQIPVASIAAGSVISYSCVTLGTVSVAASLLITIQAGVGFTPVSSGGNTDTSTFNWALVA